jgi:hypothetical protein
VVRRDRAALEIEPMAVLLERLLDVPVGLEQLVRRLCEREQDVALVGDVVVLQEVGVPRRDGIGPGAVVDDEARAADVRVGIGVRERVPDRRP